MDLADLGRTALRGPTPGEHQHHVHGVRRVRGAVLAGQGKEDRGHPPGRAPLHRLPLHRAVAPGGHRRRDHLHRGRHQEQRHGGSPQRHAEDRAATSVTSPTTSARSGAALFALDRIHKGRREHPAGGRSMTYFVGLDVGSTYAKAAILTAEGELVATAMRQTGFRLDARHPGGATTPAASRGRHPGRRRLRGVSTGVRTQPDALPRRPGHRPHRTGPGERASSSPTPARCWTWAARP